MEKKRIVLSSLNNLNFFSVGLFNKNNNKNKKVINIVNVKIILEDFDIISNYILKSYYI